MTLGGGAQPVIVSTEAPDGGPARPIVVVSAPFYAIGGPPLKVVEVTDNRARIGGPAMPVYVASGAQANSPQAGPPIPVYVVSGSLGQSYTQKVQALSPIAYWPLAEPSGATITDESGNGRNGAYANVTLGQTGIGDGRTAASFNGSTSVGNVFSASLQGAFNGAEGTLALWAKVANAGVWADATARGLVNLGVSGSNVARIQKATTANTVQGTYIAGGTNDTAPITTSSTNWIHLVVTWSKSADQVIAYLNGVQQGAPQTTLGVFAGSLAATLCTIGAASTTPTAVWNGSLAHVAVWASALSAAQIATLAVV